MKKKKLKSLALLGIFLQGVASSGVAIANNNASLLKKNTSIKGSGNAGVLKSKGKAAEKSKTVFTEGKNKSEPKNSSGDTSKGISIPNNVTTVGTVSTSAVTVGAGTAGVKKFVSYLRNSTKKSSSNEQQVTEGNVIDNTDEKTGKESVNESDSKKVNGYTRILLYVSAFIVVFLVLVFAINELCFLYRRSIIKRKIMEKIKGFNENLLSKGILDAFLGRERIFSYYGDYLDNLGALLQYPDKFSELLNREDAVDFIKKFSDGYVTEFMTSKKDIFDRIMQGEKALDIIRNLSGMKQDKLGVTLSNLVALNSQYPAKFSELLKRKDAADFIKKFSDGYVTEFMTSKKDIFDRIMSEKNALDIIKKLSEMSRKQLEVVLSNLGALNSQYSDNFSELLKRKDAADLIKSFSNGDITKFMTSKKEIFDLIMSGENALDIIKNLSGMNCKQLEVALSNLGALNSQYPAKFSELLKRKDAADLIERFSNGDITKFIDSKKEIFDSIMKVVGKALDIVVNLGRMSPEQLEVLFSEDSSESLEKITKKDSVVIKKLTYWFIRLDAEFLKFVLGECSRKLFSFLLDNSPGIFFNKMQGIQKDDYLKINYMELSNRNLLEKLELSPDVKIELFRDLLSISETEKLKIILGNGNDSPLEKIVSKFGEKNSLTVVSALREDTCSGSLKIFLGNKDYLEKIQIDKLNVIGALLRFKPNVFKKFFYSKNLFNHVFDIPNASEILDELIDKFGDSDNIILALIDKELFNREDPLNILRFLNFFKKEASLDIINNKFVDLCNFDLSKFDDSSFTRKGKIFKDFLNENSISTENLLILSTEMITFLFGEKFLYDERGSIIDKRKEILCKILKNEELTKAFSGIPFSNDGRSLLEVYPDILDEIVNDENAVNIVKAVVAHPEIAASNFWLSFCSLHTGHKYADPRNFFRMIFGKYKGISFKINGPFVLYDEQGKKTEENEVEFKFGENPEENVKEIFKGLKNKDRGADEYLLRFDFLYKAYSDQQNNVINDSIIINTNSNLINNP